jgi:hypothetical protein
MSPARPFELPAANSRFREHAKPLAFTLSHDAVDDEEQGQP